MDGIIAVLKSLLELGTPALVLVGIWVLWKAYEARTNQYIGLQDKILTMLLEALMEDLGKPKK